MVDEMIEHDVHKLGAALERLSDALSEPETSSRCTEDTAQAFVYAMSVCWKVVKELLRARGVEAHMPRDAVRYAHDKGWLEDPDLWIQMLKDEYELSGGSYMRGTAQRIYGRIKMYHPELIRAHAMMEARLLDAEEIALP
ncbi:MAG TPA: HI0074 family nucleotidyltransferase substrate-binding subunit [Armatimonadota bacterium]|jgi:nucleotidyltransferase substrate binding protein (TIGR01987 family)